MRTIILYKYRREDDGVTVSPVKPDVEYTELYRLIADEDKELTQDGVATYSCVDVDSVENWYEIAAQYAPDKLVDKHDNR